MEPERSRRLVTHAPEATEALGEALGAQLGRGAVVALHGELASGKTALVRGLARGLGVPDAVTSPTFVLMQEYQGRLPLYHFDAWMDAREGLFLEGGGAEYLGGDGVAVVEWAERVARWLPRPHLALHLVHRGPTERSIELWIEGPGEDPARTAELVGVLEDALAQLTAEGPEGVRGP